MKSVINSESGIAKRKYTRRNKNSSTQSYSAKSGKGVHVVITLAGSGTPIKALNFNNAWLAKRYVKQLEAQFGTGLFQFLSATQM